MDYLTKKEALFKQPNRLDETAPFPIKLMPLFARGASAPANRRHRQGDGASRRAESRTQLPEGQNGGEAAPQIVREVQRDLPGALRGARQEKMCHSDTQS